MSVILRKRPNKDGTTMLRLDIYHNGQRVVETLKHLKLSKPSTPLAREMNKDLLRQAEAIRVARAAELEANGYSMVSDAGKKTDVLAWLQSYVDSYKKKDKRNMQGAVNRFRDYLLTINKAGSTTFGNLNAPIIEGYIDYLNESSRGEGASSYYSRFKKAIRQAYKRRLMKENVFDFVEKKPRGKAAKKDILTLDEIKVLAATPSQSQQVRNAALFCVMSGLRWIDVKSLKWQHIDVTNKNLSLSQSKTDENVSVPLNDSALKLLGEKQQPNVNVFDLPTANGANKTLKAWVKRAGIDKKITWHNLRHSFGTNLIFTETDVLTTSKLLGHTSLRHTQTYVRAAEEMKIKATDKLNIDL